MIGRILLIFGLVAGFFGRAEAQSIPSVTTDRADYAPGSTVLISGSGFAGGEMVQLQILRINLPDNDGPEHQPWQVRASAEGDFAGTWFVNLHELGATLELTATGLASGRMAQTIFTDATVTAATGGDAIPASTAGGAWTTLTGPSIEETIVGDISTGTIVLNAPPGFVFDTNTPLPTLTVTGGPGNKNINNLPDGSTIPLTVTTNRITFAVTVKSNGQARNTVTYSGIRVRPTASTPLALGNITNSGTAIFPGSTTNFGTLREVAGAMTQLAVSGYPSPRLAGVSASLTVAAQDQFGNTVTSYAGIVTFTSSDPQAVLPANYTFTTNDNGTHTFVGVTLKTIGLQSITASNMAPASFTGTQSGISITPGPADRLAFAVEPGSAVYGLLLGPQPVVRSRDAFGNDSVVGLGTSKLVSIALTAGSGPLTGTTTIDIGTAAGNGAATFTNLKVDSAGAGKQLTATAAAFTNAVSASFTMTQATVTAVVTVSNKVYDATTGAVIATRGLTGVIAPDVVSLVGGAASFATKSAGIGKSVSISGLGLTGASAGNYALASATAGTTANITPAAVTITGTTVSNKVYDGTTVASLGGTPGLSGVIGGDFVSLGGSPAANFANKFVANNKPVTVTGYALSGPDSGNYDFSQPTGLTANITIAGLTVIGVTAADKVYDRLTNATLNTGSAVLASVVSGDSVTLNTAGATGAFANKTVGTNKPVTVAGLTISGSDASNYGLTQPSGVTASITPVGLTVLGIAANDKVYDGGASATVNSGSASLLGILSGDVVVLSAGSATGAFADKNVGNGKTVNISGLTLSGGDAPNYVITQPTATAKITAAALSITAAASNKSYDGTTAASVVLSDNRVSGDVLTANFGGAAFINKNVGTNKSVSVTGISVTGPDAGNYTNNTTATSAADITTALLTGTPGNTSRLYGAVNPGFAVNYTGFVTGEDTNVLTGTLVINTTANTNSPVGSYSVMPSGQSAPNYTIQYVAGNLAVTPAPLMAAAYDAARSYGEPNPPFTAGIWGFVNGELTNVLGGTLALSTTAVSNSPPGDYPIVPSGLISSNYSIQFLEGVLKVTTTNQGPLLAFITNAVVRPDELLTFRIYASDLNGDQVAVDLDPGAPAGATVTNLVRGNPFPSTNTTFRWRPTRDQASTTNIITVRVTDDGGPPMATTQAFVVTVLDYVEITVGSTNLQRGQTVSVPLLLSSSDGVTNLDFQLGWPADYLANPLVTATAPSVGVATIQENQDNLTINIQAAPGQVFQGTQQLAQLTFTAITNEHSAFVYLPIDAANAAKPNGSGYTNYLTSSAMVAVIEGEPLLWAFLSANSARNLTLYGLLGADYDLQYSTNLLRTGIWDLQWSYTQTNGAITIGVDSANPNIFYRLRQH